MTTFTGGGSRAYTVCIVMVQKVSFTGLVTNTLVWLACLYTLNISAVKMND